MKIFITALLAAMALLAMIVQAGTTSAGLKFLEENAKKPDVVKLDSGLQYKVIKSGNADGPHPGISTPCSCHYSGKTIEGKEFDSSYKRGQPATFAPNQVIPGWTEAMKLMREGDKWELYIPSELAYGDRQMGPDIYPGAVLIFELEMLKVLGKAEDIAKAKEL